VIEF
jgi:hypothetical protein